VGLGDEILNEIGRERVEEEIVAWLGELASPG
jgi:hypothetical protein